MCSPSTGTLRIEHLYIYTKNRYVVSLGYRANLTELHS